jgi:hypothetical protein
MKSSHIAVQNTNAIRFENVRFWKNAHRRENSYGEQNSVKLQFNFTSPAIDLRPAFLPLFYLI